MDVPVIPVGFGAGDFVCGGHRVGSTLTGERADFCSTPGAAEHAPIEVVGDGSVCSGVGVGFVVFVVLDVGNDFVFVVIIFVSVHPDKGDRGHSIAAVAGVGYV